MLLTRPLEHLRWHKGDGCRNTGICYDSGRMSAYSIGVDLGGTNLRVAALDSDGQVLRRVSIPAVYNTGPERVVSDIVKHVELRAFLENNIRVCHVKFVRLKHAQLLWVP